jgi:hypothetical protein
VAGDDVADLGVVGLEHAGDVPALVLGELDVPGAVDLPVPDPAFMEKFDLLEVSWWVWPCEVTETLIRSPSPFLTM